MPSGPAPDPLWYKDAVIYQLHVRAFHDSNSDGIGDFAGLTKKLDYIEELGATAIWVLPSRTGLTEPSFATLARAALSQR